MNDATWQPIETAPRDGTRVLLANGKLFSAGGWYVKRFGEVEYTWTGSEMLRRPHPKVGQIDRQDWRIDNPVAFKEDDEQIPDVDSNFDTWEPTHWMPLPAPPLDKPSDMP